MENKTYSEVSIKIIEPNNQFLDNVKETAFKDFFCGELRFCHG